MQQILLWMHTKLAELEEPGLQQIRQAAVRSDQSMETTLAELGNLVL